MNVSRALVASWGLLVGSLAMAGGLGAIDAATADRQHRLAQAPAPSGSSTQPAAGESRPPAPATSTGDAEGSETVARETAVEDQLVSLMVSPWAGDLDKMVEDRLIRALVVQSKTTYFVERGRQHGIAYEMLIAFEKAVNKRFPPREKHLKTHVAFVPVSRDKLMTALLEGRGDIAVADLTITQGRRKLVDFSDPFFSDIDEIIVTGPASPEVSSLGDLSGRLVFLPPTSSYREHLEGINACFVEKGILPIRLHYAPAVLEDEDLMEMVNAGLLGIIVVDDYKAELWSRVLPDIELHPEIRVHSGGEFAWMIRRDSPKLKAAINEFAKTHKEGTAFANELVERYVGKAAFVEPATSDKEIEKYRELVDLFRRYGDKYDLDHRLMMAQGYQESRLQQKAKSRVGAIGIMQLMPATGKQMQVGNVRELEANIHAGIKYHRHIIDHYFKKEPMDALNQTLFAFAAYNAGPGRIRGLRKAAVEKGLDPNVWFNNVAVIAAQTIGSETVSYVANIFKYYVAYKLVEEQEEARRKEMESINQMPFADGGTRVPTH